MEATKKIAAFSSAISLVKLKGLSTFLILRPFDIKRELVMLSDLLVLYVVLSPLHSLHGRMTF